MFCGSSGAPPGDLQVDIYAVQVFLASKVLDPRAPAPVPQPGQGGAGDTSNLLNWLGNDAVQVDPGSVERNLRTIAPVLLPDEHVEMAFQVRCSGATVPRLPQPNPLSVESQPPPIYLIPLPII